MANGNQIQQIILNLLINARQAMADGGEVQIRITEDPSEPSFSCAFATTAAASRRTSCTASSSPISRPRVARRQRQGWHGLGTEFVPTNHRSAPGRIRVESSVGKGNAFTIRLPVAEEPARESESASRLAGTGRPLRSNAGLAEGCLRSPRTVH